jgi:hypothetical protein
MSQSLEAATEFEPRDDCSMAAQLGSVQAKVLWRQTWRSLRLVEKNQSCAPRPYHALPSER